MNSLYSTTIFNHSIQPRYLTTVFNHDI